MCAGAGGAAARQVPGLCPRPGARPGVRVRVRSGRRRHAAAPRCAPLGSGPGGWLPGPGGAETPPAPVPHQRRPAQGRLRRSAVCRDLVPRRRGVLLPLPAGAGPPGGGHRGEGGAPGGSHGCQHLPEAGRHLLADKAALQRHQGPGPLPAPSARRPGGRAGGRGGDGLPRLRRPVPGAGAPALGEAVRCVPAGPGSGRSRPHREPSLPHGHRPSLPPPSSSPLPSPLLPPGILTLPCQSGVQERAPADRPGCGTGRSGRGQEGRGAGAGTQTLFPERPAPPPPARVRPRSLCPTVRTFPVDDSVVSAFEQSVQGAGLTEDHILYFPQYGFCEAADQFHVLDEVKR